MSEEININSSFEDPEMREHYDFSNAIKNPYASRLKQQVTIDLNINTIDYFKGLSAEFGIPYQMLIGLYLTDCAVHKKRPDLNAM